jgi:hypothetical protein
MQGMHNPGGPPHRWRGVGEETAPLASRSTPVSSLANCRERLAETAVAAADTPPMSTPEQDQVQVLPFWKSLINFPFADSDVSPLLTTMFQSRNLVQFSKT